MLLRYCADLRTLAFVGIYFALFAYQWTAAPTAWALAVPLLLATCVFSFLGAVATHNIIHAPMGRAKWMWRTYGWPGKRLRYDGAPLDLPPAGEDQSWIPAVRDTPVDVSLGAEA